MSSFFPLQQSSAMPAQCHFTLHSFADSSASLASSACSTSSGSSAGGSVASERDEALFQATLLYHAQVSAWTQRMWRAVKFAMDQRNNRDTVVKVVRSEEEVERNRRRRATFSLGFADDDDTI